VFNVRATSSRRSEGVSSPVLCPLLEYSASSLCPHEEPRTHQHPASQPPRPEGHGDDRYNASKPVWRPSTSHRPALRLRRAVSSVSDSRQTSVETFDDLWLDTKPRRVRHQAAASPQSPEGLLSEPARARVTLPRKRLTTSDPTSNPEGSDTKLPSHLRAPKDFSVSRNELASTLPWNRLTIPGPRPSSEELNVELPSRVKAPKSSSASLHGLASTPPWSRLMTSHKRPSSEEFSLELPTSSGAPKSTGAS
jgi:hypothetical protein